MLRLGYSALLSSDAVALTSAVTILGAGASKEVIRLHEVTGVVLVAQRISVLLRRATGVPPPRNKPPAHKG